MTYPFILHRQATGKIWQAGHDVYGLCSAHNLATDPSLPMTDHEHARARMYARAIRARMTRLGLRLGRDYRELSNGAYWPTPLQHKQ